MTNLDGGEFGGKYAPSGMKAVFSSSWGGSVSPWTRSRGRRGPAVMAADLGTITPARAACPGGSLALLLAGVALWVRPTERGALARVVGEADLGTPATRARAIRGGKERVTALNTPSREVWRGKESAPPTLLTAPLGCARGHQETVVPGSTPPGWGFGGVRRDGVTARLRLRPAAPALGPAVSRLGS